MDCSQVWPLSFGGRLYDDKSLFFSLLLHFSARRIGHDDGEDGAPIRQAIFLGFEVEEGVLRRVDLHCAEVECGILYGTVRLVGSWTIASGLLVSLPGFASGFWY